MSHLPRKSGHKIALRTADVRSVATWSSVSSESAFSSAPTAASSRSGVDLGCLEAMDRSALGQLFEHRGPQLLARHPETSHIRLERPCFTT